MPATREEVLAFEARRRLYHLVEAHPGLHLRGLQRLTGMALGTLRYHLGYLAEHGLVAAHEDKRFLRYFATPRVEPAQREVLAALRQVALRRILLFLLARGGEAPYPALRAAFPVAASTFALHLRELTRRGLVARRAVSRSSAYRVRDPEAVIRALHSYRASFLDTLVDHLLDAVHQDEPTSRPDAAGAEGPEETER